MPVFDSATLTRFTEDGEKDFNRDYPHIIDRLSLDIVAGTHTYTLPEYVLDIRRVTWLGYKVDPQRHRPLRDRELSLTATAAKPTDYVFDNIGQQQIRFYPIPSVTIASTNVNLYGSEIPNRVIVEYYRIPDHTSQIIPSFFRRRLLKAYVMKAAHSIEGKGQNFKAAGYWARKYFFLKETYGSLLDELINEPRRIIIGGMAGRNLGIPRPVLPYDQIGIGVDKGE